MDNTDGTLFSRSPEDLMVIQQKISLLKKTLNQPLTEEEISWLLSTKEKQKIEFFLFRTLPASSIMCCNTHVAETELRSYNYEITKVGEEIKVDDISGDCMYTLRGKPFRPGSWMDSFIGTLPEAPREEKDVIRLIVGDKEFSGDILVWDPWSCVFVFQRRFELLFPEKDAVKEAVDRVIELFNKLKQFGSVFGPLPNGYFQGVCETLVLIREDIEKKLREQV